MKCKDIIEILEREYNPSFAESWDNVGLLAGDREREVKRVFLALDVTDETLKAAIDFKADMMITHHPLIFSGIDVYKRQARGCKMEITQRDVYTIDRNVEKARRYIQVIREEIEDHWK